MKNLRLSVGKPQLLARLVRLNSRQRCYVAREMKIPPRRYFFIPRLRDRANIEHTSSNSTCILNTFARRLLDVCSIV